jgi:lipid-A-disaccharide synthase
VLCLLPFETAFYSRHGVSAVFVGHPLADQIPLEIDRAGAREELGLPPCATLVALLPGSRVAEIERLGADFLRAAAWLAERRPDLQFIAPMATPGARESFASKQAEVAGAPKVLLLEGRAQQVLAACDAAIVASGTATLETLLSRRPMVVAYRFGALTAFLLRRLRLVKVPYFSQPNLLVSRPLVPELLQEQVSGAALGQALLGRLSDPEYLRELDQEFRKVHERLRGGAAARAADAVLALLEAPLAQGSAG